jgi:hypothetical protein
MEHQLPNSFLDAVAGCSDTQLDTAFAVLRDMKNGILRKSKCFALIFQTSEDELIDSLPKTDDGRILDKISRNMFCAVLVDRQNRA